MACRLAQSPGSRPLQHNRKATPLVGILASPSGMAQESTSKRLKLQWRHGQLCACKAMPQSRKFGVESWGGFRQCHVRNSVHFFGTSVLHEPQPLTLATVLMSFVVPSSGLVPRGRAPSHCMLIFGGRWPRSWKGAGRDCQSPRRKLTGPVPRLSAVTKTRWRTGSAITPPMRMLKTCVLQLREGTLAGQPAVTLALKPWLG